MKVAPMAKTLTFGDVIEGFYSAYGKRKAQGLLRLAVKTHLLVFRGRHHYVLSKGRRKA